MAYVTWGIFAIAMLACIATSIWFYVVAFRQHILWGLACFFVPFAAIVFLIKYWHLAWKSFAACLVSMLICFVSFAANPDIQKMIAEGEAEQKQAAP